MINYEDVISLVDMISWIDQEIIVIDREIDEKINKLREANYADKSFSLEGPRQRLKVVQEAIDKLGTVQQDLIQFKLSVQLQFDEERYGSVKKSA